MTRATATSLALLLASILSPTLAAAQREARPEGDSIPRALAEALLLPYVGMMSVMTGQNAAPRLVVGVVPTGLAERLWIPPDATILGGLQSSGMGVAVLQSALSVDSLQAGYRREQLLRGWTYAPTNEPERIMGFAPALPDEAAERPLAFCRGGDYLSIAIETTPGRRRIMAHASDIGREVCNPRSRERGYPSWWSGRPTLINPRGVEAELGQSCLRRNGGGGGSTLLITAMPLEDVMTHYGAQLADSGWAAVGGDQSLQRSWTRRDSTGTIQEVTLTVRRRGASPRCIEVGMEFSGTPR